MTRIMLIEVADTDAEDAIAALLALAEDKPHLPLTTEHAALAVAQLACHIDGIKVLYSTPVGGPAPRPAPERCPVTEGGGWRCSDRTGKPHEHFVADDEVEP